MKLSGFSFAKNAGKLYYPLRPAIESILPIVDEFVVAIGDNDADDTTMEELSGIRSEKLKIVRTVWDLGKFPNGMENAHQTDIAKSHCTGDWLFYLQADEVVHEKFHPAIVAKCEEMLPRTEVEGLLFDYLHFWGDYDHHLVNHCWYPKEIRIVRNLPEIHSYQSAQSFRRIPQFDGLSYRQREGTHKLNVAKVNAAIYHYGWVRPPELMVKKRKALDTIHKGSEKVTQMYEGQSEYFDYGNMASATRFTGTHPAAMQDWIKKFNWADKLNFDKNYRPQRELLKHERLKYRLITLLEQKVFGRQLGGYSNWNIVA